MAVEGMRVKAGGRTRGGRTRGGRTRSARAGLALGGLALAVAIALAAPQAALAKSYGVTDVSIAARVEPDGLLDVREERTFSFDGDFTFVYWEIDMGGVGALDIVALEGPEGPYRLTDDPNVPESRPPNTYSVEQGPDTTRVTAYFRLSDTDATFTLAYRMRGAVMRYADTADLYWQAVGDRWEVGADRVVVDIDLPEGVTKDDVKAFGHGPLTGVVEVAEDGDVRLTVDDLPAGTFVEPRVLFPPDAIPQADRIDQARRDEILADELEAAAEADAARQRARAFVWLARLVGYGLTLALLAFAIVIFRRHGREYDTAFVGEYFREDPGDLHPAVAGVLWRMGGVTDAELAATLMDMANRGLVTMRPVRESKPGFLGTKEVETYELTLDRDRLAEARPLDRSLARTLFDEIAGDDTLTIEELKAYAKAHARSFASEMNEWKADAKAEGEALGLFEPAGRRWQIGLAVLAVLVAGGAVTLAIVSGAIDAAVFAVLATIPVFVVVVFMPRRSRAAAELHAKYEALRNYLRDFSRLHEAPPASVVLWNHFLVLAVVFGIAEEVIEQMRVVIPDVVKDPAFQTTYWWAYSSGPGSSSPVSSLQSGFASAAQIASSQSSSTGGGGGFSGGGGGGAGGGGGGAG